MCRHRHVVVAALVCLAAGCAEKPPEPAFASSAGSPGYATEFPEELGAVRAGFSDQEKLVRAVAAELPRFPGELDQPDWEVVRAVVQHADQDGRSQAYADRLEDVEGIRRFYESDKDELRRKVAGAVQYAAKKKQCEGDVGSSAGPALDKALEERLSERLHASSDAHLVIEQHADALGPKNVAALERQADAIARASYEAHVGVVRTKLRLRRMLEESEHVAETLDRTTRDLDALRARTDLDEKTRQRLEERRTAAARARGRISAEASGAEGLSRELEDRIRALQEHFRAAVDELVASVQKRATDASSGKR